MLYLGFDIGGTKCAACLGVKDGGRVEIVDRRAIATPGDWRDALARLFNEARAMLAGRAPDAAGFSCGGPLDWKTGVVLSPPNLPGWDRVPVTALARETFGAPAFLENDANACALAEWRYGAGVGAESMMFLTFGTGLGAGLILDGRLIRGASGNAGEAGHMRLADFGPAGYGKEGSFEGFCSGGGIAQLAETHWRRARQRGETPGYACGADARAVAEAARSGDKAARDTFDTTARMLGKGLALAVDLVDPGTVVIGSIFARCRDLLEDGMWAELRREALPGSARNLRVLPAALGEQIGDYAAVGVAAYGLGERV